MIINHELGMIGIMCLIHSSQLKEINMQLTEGAEIYQKCKRKEGFQLSANKLEDVIILIGVN